MTGEICLYDKFGYCKRETKCNRIHLKETCNLLQCNYQRCQKRHPRTCKFYNQNGNCKFGSKCKYDHKMPKSMETQNKKIEALERKTEMLLEMIKDQNVIIMIVTSPNTSQL